MWEFLRNDIFNSNAFFRNSTGQGKPNLKQNQFGATFGGPIRHNKLFFFTSYQGTRQGQRARHHLHLEPDSARPHRRPFRVNARLAVLRRQPRRR